MSKTIFKYPLTDHRTSMPEGSKVLQVGVKDGMVTLWAEVDATRPSVTRSFVIIPTGGVVGDNEKHVGSCISPGHNFVWHVYERAPQ